jgi:large subunit ribosomal protein L30
MTWAVVRVRGTIHAQEPLVETLRHLHLTRANHAVVVPETPAFSGMVYAVQGYVTWGPVGPQTVELLVRERGRLRQGSPVPSEEVADLARRVHEEGLPAAPRLKPLFRLKAPRGGWRSTKRPYALGGALGYRPSGTSDDMDHLLARMV